MFKNKKLFTQYKCSFTHKRTNHPYQLIKSLPISDRQYLPLYFIISHRGDVLAAFSSKQVSLPPLNFHTPPILPSHTTSPTSCYRSCRRRSSPSFTLMIGNPDNLGRVKFLRLLSHQRHIANYLGCLFGEETVV